MGDYALTADLAFEAKVERALRFNYSERMRQINNEETYKEVRELLSRRHSIKARISNRVRK